MIKIISVPFSCEVKPNNQPGETVGRKLTNLFQLLGTLLRQMSFQPILNMRTSVAKNQNFDFIEHMTSVPNSRNHPNNCI